MPLLPEPRSDSAGLEAQPWGTAQVHRGCRAERVPWRFWDLVQGLAPSRAGGVACRSVRPPSPSPDLHFPIWKAPELDTGLPGVLPHGALPLRRLFPFPPPSQLTALWPAVLPMVTNSHSKEKRSPEVTRRLPPLLGRQHFRGLSMHSRGAPVWPPDRSTWMAAAGGPWEGRLLPDGVRPKVRGSSCTRRPGCRSVWSAARRNKHSCVYSRNYTS